VTAEPATVTPVTGSGRTLSWHADELLSPPARAALTGPGGAFEIVTADVLGAPALVFRQRPPHLRAVLEQAGRDHADRVFLVAPDGAEITYADAVRRVALVAGTLERDYGIGKGDRVAFAATNSVAYILGYWAALSLGAILVNLNGWWTAPELAYGIELTTPVVVLADAKRQVLLQRLAASSAGPWPPVVALEVAVAEGLAADGLAADPARTAAMPTTAIDEDDPVTILFTSGTTGRAKGATLTHRNWIHFALANGCGAAVGAALAGAGGGAGGGPVSIFAAPIFHVSGTGPLTSAPFTASTLVLPPPGRWNELVTLQLVERSRVTVLSGVPTQFWRILQHPDFDRYDTSSVGFIGGGGAVCPPELARLMAAKLPRAVGGNGYGMTETSGLGTRLSGPAFRAHPGTVGGVGPTMRMQVRGPGGDVLGEGEIGEIFLWGAGVFAGYWNDPAATAKVLDGERWYRTGDFGQINGELLTLESRMRDLIIRGGENIYPIEIENRLVEHAEISDAAVIGVDHRTLGQEVKAFVVPAPGCAPSTEDVRRFVGQALASYKVPAYVEFRESLPYSATGKLLKRELEDSARGTPMA